jgi:hypothetical protein
MDPISIALGLAQFVPSIVRWVAGDKAGDAAQTVVGVAQAVTGKATGPEALEAMRADVAAQQAFQERMAAITNEMDKAYLVDRQDARKTSTDRAKISETVAASDARRKNAMIIGDVVGLVVCLAVLTFVPDLPGEVRGIISTIAGFFGLGLRDAHQFEFGSSRGSETKTVMLAGK